MYTISDQCGQQIGRNRRGMGLVLRYAGHTYILSIISVLSELGAVLEE